MASAQALATLGLQTAKPYIDNSDKYMRQAREKVDRIRRRSMSRRRGVASADLRSRSAGANSDYSSEDDYYQRRSGRGRDRRRTKDSRSYDPYESEGSIPPQSRQVVPARGNKGAVAAYPGYQSGYYGNSQKGTKSENDRGNGSSSSESDDPSIMDSEEDERLEKKKRRNELITGGIAAVATLHAAAGVYNNMKSRELQIKQLAEGTISKEDAKRQRYKQHFQDAASIGLAALSIKGAYGKWQGAANKHREVKSHREERRARQEKRMKKGLSRYNCEADRAAAAAKGLPAPGYQHLLRSATTGDSNGSANSSSKNYDNSNASYQGASSRPKYSRTYSRSADGYGRRSSGRSYGRSSRKGYANQPANYDGDNAYNGIDDWLGGDYGGR